MIKRLGCCCCCWSLALLPHRASFDSPSNGSHKQREGEAKTKKEKTTKEEKKLGSVWIALNAFGSDCTTATTTTIPINIRFSWRFRVCALNGPASERVSALNKPTRWLNARAANHLLVCVCVVRSAQNTPTQLEGRTHKLMAQLFSLLLFNSFLLSKLSSVCVCVGQREAGATVSSG